MKFWDWVSSKFSGRDWMDVDVSELRDIMGETHVRELAYWSCVGLIARMVSKCEFQTLTNGRPVKGAEWYRWNISPNLNQSSTQFLSKLVHSLYGDQHAALVVEVNGQLLVADSWVQDDKALVDSVFSGVTINGYTLNNVYRASDVLYFQQSPYNMRVLTNLLYDTYSKLIAYSARTYQASRGRKGILKLDTHESDKLTQDEKAKRAAIMKSKFDKFFSQENAVLTLYNGQDYTDLSGNKTYTQETTRDLRAMIDDVVTYDARALGVAPALLLGDVSGIDAAVQWTLTSCIDPLTDMIAEEINRKRYGMSAVLSGTYLRVDTTTIQHTDLLAQSASVEKLVSSGVFSINDILRKLGEPTIPEPWADEHFITKNFSTIQDYLKGVDGNGTP